MSSSKHLILTSLLSLLTQHTLADIEFNVLSGSNFPDPCIINVGGTSYSFATVDGAGHNIPVTSNADFSDANGWSSISDAFPTDGVPAFGDGGWAVPGTTWAPDVQQLTDWDNSFAMYYSPALKSNSGVHCIGLARSLNIKGPYNDSSSAPLICPESAGGAIDAAGYLDTGSNTRYVVYKIDGPAANNGGYCNNPNNPPSTNTSLMLQQVEHDAYTPIGGPVVLYNNEGVSDKYNIEAPSLAKGPDGTFFLFFSSGCYSDNSYTTNYVTSTSGIWGPYGDRQVLVKSGDEGLSAPGGLDVDQATGDVVLHSDLQSGTVAKGRVLDTGSITLSGRTATVN